MSIIAKKANPAEIDTPSTGKVSLYVDCNDGKIKIKDSNGCVNTLAYAGGIECADAHVDVLLVGGGGANFWGKGGDGTGYPRMPGGGGGVCEHYFVSVGDTTTVTVGDGGRTSCACGGRTCFGNLFSHGGNLCGVGSSGNGILACGDVSCTAYGGAGAGTSGSIPGRGGDGLKSCMSGTFQWYGGGGAGFQIYGSGAGVPGCGGGGCFCNPNNATYYGGGAGGQHCYDSGHGCGYQGIAIVRYKTDGSMGVKCATGGTITCCNGYTIHTFSTVGTSTFTVTCKRCFYPVA